MTDPLQVWLDGLCDGLVRVPRCADCGMWNWYPRPLCRRCGCRDMTWVDVGATGRVHTWTEVVQAVDPVEDLHPPYVTALITPATTPEVRIPMLATASARTPVIGEFVAFEAVETSTGRALAFRQHTC